MQRLSQALLALGLLALASVPAAAMPGKIQVVTSPGGITAWLAEETAVPIISVRFAFSGGGALDPVGKEGLANMVSGLLDEGAGELDALAFQTRKDELAMRLSFDASRDDFFGSFATLKRNRDESFELLRLALTAPRFDEKPVERIRRQIIVGLTRDLEQPGTIAGRDWFKAVFGDHPYWHATDGTLDGAEAIVPDDLKGFVRRRFAKDNLKISVVGDIDAKTLGRLLDHTFGALPATSAAGSVPAAAFASPGGLKVIRRPIPQSTIYFGLPGIKRDDPDWYVAHLMNYVLGGGGQSSRLYEEVREKRGLAYSAYSYLMPFENAGLYIGGAGTRNAKVAETLATIRTELARMRDGGITEKELTDAKTYIDGSFPLRLTSSGRIAGLLLAMQRHDLGLDYLERRAGIYDAITLADVARVAKRLLQPEKMYVVVVGDPQGVESDD